MKLSLEDDLLVGAAFDDVGQRHARVGLRDLARQQQPRAQRAHFEQRRIAAARRVVARLQLRARRAAPVRPRPPRDPRRARPSGAAARRGTGSDRGRPIRCRSAWAADRRPASGTACRRETRRRSAAAPTLPMLSRSGSNSISVKPQLCGTSALAPRLDVALEVALLLLEVLGLQEQPFGPDDSTMSRHACQTPRGGHAWSRNRRYRRSRSACVTVTVEVHATLNL